MKKILDELVKELELFGRHNAIRAYEIRYASAKRKDIFEDYWCIEVWINQILTFKATCNLRNKIEEEAEENCARQILKTAFIDSMIKQYHFAEERFQREGM